MVDRTNFGTISAPNPPSAYEELRRKARKDLADADLDLKDAELALKDAELALKDADLVLLTTKSKSRCLCLHPSRYEAFTMAKLRFYQAEREVLWQKQEVRAKHERKKRRAARLKAMFYELPPSRNKLAN